MTFTSGYFSARYSHRERFISMSLMLVPVFISIGARYSAILPPPTMSTFLLFLLRSFSSCVSSTSDDAGAVTYILSPLRRTKLPSGIKTFSSRRTAQMRTCTRIFRRRSAS